MADDSTITGAGESETKGFDPAILATLSTGILLVHPFSLAHEAAEWILGHPIWTHQFSELADELGDAVIAQFPEMPTSLVNHAGWEGCRNAVRDYYGASVQVRRGNGETARDSLDRAALADRGAGR